MSEEKTSCCCPGTGCCGPEQIHPALVGERASWVIGEIETPVGSIPRVSTTLTWCDRVGSWKVRWGIGRTKYRIHPGLYAVGNPDQNSHVLVTANYKMTFDRLRQELTGQNLWILVLDTKGINVWCAAGKGTFGTEEIVNRIKQTGLKEVVKHRTLILPQLGAPGVAAHIVARHSGFKVVYGPIRAEDLPAFLTAGQKATPEMRQVRFGFWDRLILTPIELTGFLKPTLLIFVVLFLLNFITAGPVTFWSLLGQTLAAFLPYLGAILTGAVLVPAFLPYIPGRAFALKGWLMGLLWAGIYILLIAPGQNLIQAAVFLLLLPPLASFPAMNFTGATTYTSLSGVVREMQIAVPAQAISAGLGIVALVVGLIFGMD